MFNLANFLQGFGMPQGFGGNNIFLRKYACHSVAFHNPELEDGGKIVLPSSALDELSSLRIQYPMLFQLSNPSVPGKITHVGVMEFTADEGKCYVPYWIMQHLLIEEGGFITVRNVALQKGTFVRLQPQTSTFLDISNPRIVLEKKLRNFSALTQGDEILIQYNNKNYFLNVIEVKPLDQSKGISIVEADVTVDFAPPLDYKEPQKPVETKPVSVPGIPSSNAVNQAKSPSSPSTVKSSSVGTSPASFPGQGYTVRSPKTTTTSTTTSTNNNNNNNNNNLSSPKTTSASLTRKQQDEEEYDDDVEEDQKDLKKFKAFSGKGYSLK